MDGHTRKAHWLRRELVWYVVSVYGESCGF
jgi:hypothetical protein